MALFCDLLVLKRNLIGWVFKTVHIAPINGHCKIINYDDKSNNIMLCPQLYHIGNKKDVLEEIFDCKGQISKLIRLVLVRDDRVALLMLS